MIKPLMEFVADLFQDGHEICFVGDEAFRELSQFDPTGDKLLTDVRSAQCLISIHV